MVPHTLGEGAADLALGPNSAIPGPHLHLVELGAEFDQHLPNSSHIWSGSEPSWPMLSTHCRTSCQTKNKMLTGQTQIGSNRPIWVDIGRMLTKVGPNRPFVRQLWPEPHLPEQLLDNCSATPGQPRSLLGPLGPITFLDAFRAMCPQSSGRDVGDRGVRAGPKSDQQHKIARACAPTPELDDVMSFPLRSWQQKKAGFGGRRPVRWIGRPKSGLATKTAKGNHWTTLSMLWTFCALNALVPGRSVEPIFLQIRA